MWLLYKMMPFMSKKKKFKFQVRLELEELSDVPFVTGVLYAKVRLLDGGTFLEQSPRQEVNNNTVRWGSQFQFPCKMTTSHQSGLLDSCNLRISVRKELKGGKSQQKLGYLDIDLATFAGGSKVQSRRILQAYDQRHRVDNSKFAFSLELSLVSGDPVFKVPSMHPVSSQDKGHGSSDPIDLRDLPSSRFDNHSEDSSSSGFSSLPRRGKSDMDMDPSTDTHGHSRSASYASQHSRGSGTPSSVGSTLERRRKLEEAQKDMLVGGTRVNAEDIVNELISNSDLDPNEIDADSKGLRLEMQEDGSMVVR